LLLILLAVYTLAGTLGYAGPTLAQASDPVGQLTLRWTMTVQASDTFTKDYRTDWPEDYEWETEVATDQLTLVYQGQWTWQVTRDDADRVQLDRGQGRYDVAASGGGNQQIESWEGPRGVYCTQGRGGYWVPASYNSSTQWTYQATKGDDWHVYAALSRQGDEMAYRVNWDWDQQISLDGAMTENSRGCTSSSSSEPCGTSTFYGGCPGAGGAESYAMIFVLGQAMRAWEEQEVLRGKVRPQDWGFSASGRAAFRPEPIVESQTTEEYKSQRTMQGSAALEYTLTYEREPTNLEAVIVVPGEGEYERWLPEAGRDEDSIGNQLRVETELRYKDRPDETPFEKATFRFRLTETSREPGVCLNAPAKDQAKDTFDLKIDQDCNPDLEVGDEGQSASTTEPARGAGVTISCYDWGAYGRLQVTATTEDGRLLVAHLDGQPEQEQLTIPRDDNDNHIADSWEENEGVLGKNYPAGWDGSPIPRKQESDGDGIALYEKYRGFEFGTGSRVRHERLVALAKHVFVYDPDGIVLSTTADPRSVESSLPRVSQCRVRFVDGTHWTGPGESGSDKRLVNFNTSGFGHAVDQHAIDVRLDASATPIDPPEWAAAYAAAAGTAYTGTVDGARGITYPDYSTGRNMASPQDTFRVVIFSNNIWKSIQDAVTFHTKALPQFASAAAGDLQREATRYLAEHMDQASELYQKQMARVISHEAGHALGVEHHDPTISGDKTCVTRYQSRSDRPRNANDRFELACYDPWPHKFCTSGANCWGQVQVSDRP